MAVVWALAVTAGMAWMIRYQMRPGVAVAAPARLPVLLSVSRGAARPTLVVLLHPQCPCSEATVSELSQLMARVKDRVDAYVLFVKPDHAPPDWLDGDLWRQAKKVPGVRVMVDVGGKDAAALGATTSGEVLVYDAQGRLQFNGGITDGRGHEGDNPGYLAVLSLLLEGKATVAATPVYGCSLGVCSLKTHATK